MISCRTLQLLNYKNDSKDNCFDKSGNQIQSGKFYANHIHYLIITALLMSISCGSLAPGSTTPYSKNGKKHHQRKEIVNLARSYKGTSYKYGGGSKQGMDCSGLVYTVYAQKGISLPRTSTKQYGTGKSINVQKAQAGDLVFFTQRGRINHVGIVSKIKSGQIWVVHSTTSSGVIEEDIRSSSYWNKRIRGVRDVVR